MKRRFKRILVLTVLIPMLLLSACFRIPGLNTGTPKPASSPSVAVETPSPVPTDWHSGVQTDYSGLTPYQQPEEKYTRLTDGAMPNLKPSRQYGRLLPYLGETMYTNDGYNSIRKYGLMTASGMLVTDPVYSRVYQGSYYNFGTYKGDTVPVYSLTKMSDKIDVDDPWNSEIYAACAADGSWATKFEYKTIFFTDKAVMLVRNYDNNDIDIMDFSGKLLYNTKSLSCYSDIPAASAYAFQSGYGEGLVALPLSSGRTVFIDLLTGKETYTDYTSCNAFSGGFAAAMQNGLYGYIDKEYDMVIPPQYIWVDYFYNGKSVVQYDDSSYAIIDQHGNTLFENPYYVSRWDSSTYCVYDADNNNTYYDSGLNKITSGTKTINTLYDGWYYYNEGSGITVFKGDEKHTFLDITGVNSVSGNLITVFKNDSSSWQEGLLTLDGDVVIPMTESVSISVVTSEKTGEIFAVASSYDSSQSYTVYNGGGEVLFSGNGYASFNTQFDLFEVNDELSYAYIDTAGRDIFRISLLQYVPD